MFKKVMMTFACAFLLCQTSFAERCPSVSEIKNNKLQGWKVFDSDDGKPLAAARETQFRQIVEQFALAEWTNNKKQLGSIHCYYRDKTGSSLEAYLAKDNFHPQLDSKNFWYEVSGYMHCAASMENCEFINPLTAKQHLAMRGK